MDVVGVEVDFIASNVPKKILFFTKSEMVTLGFVAKNVKDII